MAFSLGIDLGFARNRYQEPEVWSRIVREDLDLKNVSLVADIFNPDWPEEYLQKLSVRMQNCLADYDIKVGACFTSSLTRTPHLMHYDEEMRRFYLNWFKKFFQMAAELGCKIGGSHFGIISFTDFDNPERRAFIYEEAIKGWQELSFYVKDLGYEYLVFEPMSVPREMGNTVAECLQLMDAVNANSGVPMRICLDVGHSPHPDERDPYQWIEALGRLSPLVHLQQTTMHRSNHSPFTPEFNATGIIKPEKVLESLKKSGAADSLLAFEISHREHYDTEFRIIDDLKASVNYWKPFITE